MTGFSSSLAWCKTHHKQTISISAIIVAVVLLMFPAPRVPVVDTIAITAPLLELSKLYVAQTVIQIIVLPIASFYVMMKLVNALFQTRLPVIVKDSLSQNKSD